MKKLDEIFMQALDDVEVRARKAGMRSASGLFDRAGLSRSTLDRWRAEVPRTIQIFARVQAELEDIERKQGRPIETIKRAADHAADWRLPDDAPPPAGQMVQLLSVAGKATYGVWGDSGYWVAWAPFLKISPRVKARMVEQEKKWRKA